MTESPPPACALRSLIFIPVEDAAPRPVPAERIADNRYRIVGNRPDGERWLFGPGQVVECENRPGSERLVAVRVVD